MKLSNFAQAQIRNALKTGRRYSRNGKGRKKYLTASGVHWNKQSRNYEVSITVSPASFGIGRRNYPTQKGATRARNRLFKLLGIEIKD